MLIRDISAMNEAVSLSVLGGSLSDPRDMQGLAHYLEHSVFLGSKVLNFYRHEKLFLRMNFPGLIIKTLRNIRMKIVFQNF